MAIEVLQNTPIEIDLLARVNDNGWTLDGEKAIHESCNAGYINYVDEFDSNVIYNVSMQVDSISNGVIALSLGNSQPVEFSTAGLKQFQISSTIPSSKLILYSNANTVIKIIALRKSEEASDIAPEKKDTIVYSKQLLKWSRFDNYYPNYGYSIFTNLYTFKNGAMYSHTDSVNKNRFYGNQYKSRINIPFSSPKVKTFQSINVESNKLLITTTDGIKTSLGQLSELIAEDFRTHTLNDGITSIDVYDKEGVLTANFLRDSNTNILTGDRLKGTYMTINLTTTDEQDFNLFRVRIRFVESTPNA